MRAGSLRDVIDVLQPATIKDEYGNARQEWILLMSIRASRDFRSGSRQQENYEMVNTHRITLKTHLRRDIKRQMRMVFQGETYVIESVCHYTDRRETIIECELLID